MFNQTLAMKKDTEVLLKTFNGYDLIRTKITNEKFEIKAINTTPNWIEIIKYHAKINPTIDEVKYSALIKYKKNKSKSITIEYVATDPMSKFKGLELELLKIILTTKTIEKYPKIEAKIPKWQRKPFLNIGFIKTNTLSLESQYDSWNTNRKTKGTKYIKMYLSKSSFKRNKLKKN